MVGISPTFAAEGVLRELFGEVFIAKMFGYATIW